MAMYQELDCIGCKHYESYYQYPNPNAVARHYCTKCGEEIKYIRSHIGSDFFIVWLPKGCYFNNYFEESEASKKIREEKFIDYGFCQIED